MVVTNGHGPPFRNNVNGAHDRDITILCTATNILSHNTTLHTAN